MHDTKNALSARLQALSLSGENCNVDELNDLRDILCHTPPSRLRQQIADMPIDRLFPLSLLEFTSSDNEVCETAIAIVTLLLNALPENRLIPDLCEHFSKGLSHHASCVRMLCIKQLLRFSNAQPRALNKEFLSLVLASLGRLNDEDGTVANQAAFLIQSVGAETLCTDQRFASEIKTSYSSVTDTVRFRIHEMLVDMACDGQQSFKALCGYSLLDPLLGEFIKDDILLQLNCLELLGRLACLPYGLDFLKQHGFIDLIEAKISNYDSEPFGQLLLPGLIKFFGGLAYLDPAQGFRNHPRFVSMIVQYCQNAPDEQLRGLAIDTVALIGSRPPGKLVLFSTDGFSGVLQTTGILIRSSSSDLRVKALNLFSSLLSTQPGEISGDAIQLSEQTLLMIDSEGGSILSEILALARQPFVAIRHAALQALCAAAGLRIGQQKLSAVGTFVEYITDRRTESEKIGKELKFEVVAAVVKSPFSESAFEQHELLKLRLYHREGPFYVDAQSEVALERD